MGSKQLELRWPDHDVNLHNAFSAQQRNQMFVDVTLVGGNDGSSVKAHRNVMSASSSFLQKIFVDHPCPHPVIVLSGVDGVGLTGLVDFVYRGVINTTADQLPSILACAESLKIAGLADVVRQRVSAAASDSHERLSAAPPTPCGNWSGVDQRSKSSLQELAPAVDFEAENVRETIRHSVRRRRRRPERAPSPPAEEDMVLDLAVKMEPFSPTANESARQVSCGESYDPPESPRQRPSALLAYLTGGTVFNHRLGLSPAPSEQELLSPPTNESVFGGGTSNHAVVPAPRRRFSRRAVDVPADPDRRYSCKLCSKTFRTLRCLKAHGQLHNPFRMAHACSLCTRVYQRRGELLRHFKLFHPDMPIPYHQRYRPGNRPARNE